MIKLHATPEGGGLVSHNPAFRSILINLTKPETRALDYVSGRQTKPGDFRRYFTARINNAIDRGTDQYMGMVY